MIEAGVIFVVVSLSAFTPLLVAHIRERRRWVTTAADEAHAATLQAMSRHPAGKCPPRCPACGCPARPTRELITPALTGQDGAVLEPRPPRVRRTCVFCQCSWDDPP